MCKRAFKAFKAFKARLHMRFLMRFLMRFRVQNVPDPTLHERLFREASCGLERKVSHIIWRQPSFEFLPTWRYFVAALRDYKPVRGRLGQVLCAKSHQNRIENRMCKGCILSVGKSSRAINGCTSRLVFSVLCISFVFQTVSRYNCTIISLRLKTKSFRGRKLAPRKSWLINSFLLKHNIARNSEHAICTPYKLMPTNKRAARWDITKKCMGPDNKSCFSPQLSVFVKMFQRREKKRSFLFTTVQRLFSSGKNPCVQISKNHFGRCHKDYIGKWHK